MILDHPPNSLWDSPNWADIEFLAPEFITLPPTSYSPSYQPPITSPTALDNVVIGFGKKYPTKSPIEILKIDPGYIVWCRENTTRVFCSDELLAKARKLYVPRSR